MLSSGFDISMSPAFLRLSALPISSGSSVQSIIITSLALFLTYIFTTAIYRLYFHPLSHYPGPPLAAITGLYRSYYIVIGKEQRNCLKLHEKYGPVIRTAPDHLVYIDPEAWKDIYGHRTGGKKSNKRVILNVRHPGHESVIATQSDKKHGERRRIFAHAFSDKALREQEPMFQKYVDLLVSTLGSSIAEASDQKFNIVDWYNFTTFDVMGDLTFSEPLGMLQNSAYSPWVQSIFKAIKTNTLMFATTQYGPFRFLLKLLIPASLTAARERHFQFSEERVDRRLERGSTKPDIWSLIIKQAGEKAVSVKEMYSNSDLFMIAGTETTATLLSGLTFYLLKTPHAMKRLRAELDEAFPGGEGVTSEKLAQLKYLQACLDEALRVYPPVPLATLRETPDEGAMIAGQFVPGGTRMGVTHFAAYHSPKNFALPEEFHPERWLPAGEPGANDPRFANDNKAVHQPFNIGPRNCLGRNMAWYEMRLIAARMFLHFDIDLCPESDQWQDQKIFALWEKKPLMVKLKQRQGAVSA